MRVATCTGKPGAKGLTKELTGREFASERRARMSYSALAKKYGTPSDTPTLHAQHWGGLEAGRTGTGRGHWGRISDAVRDGM